MGPSRSVEGTPVVASSLGERSAHPAGPQKAPPAVDATPVDWEPRVYARVED